MIYLAKPSSFDLRVDNVNHELLVGKDIVYDDVLEGTLDYLRPCLLNRGLDVPIHLYRVYQNLHHPDEKTVSSDGKTRYDMMLMPPNVMGIEYVKTHGHMVVGDLDGKQSYPVIIEVLYGAATFIIQKLNPNYDPMIAFEPEVSEVYIVKAKKGEKVLVPPGYYHSMINTRSTYLVTGRLHFNWETKAERLKVEDKHGLAYFVIRKNARQEIVQNPRYKNSPRIKKLKPEQTTKVVGFRSTKSLVAILRKSPERFEFLVKPQKFDWQIRVK